MITRSPAKNSAEPITYTGSFSNTDSAAQVATQIFSPAANVNGAYIEYIGFSGTVNGTGNGTCSEVTILAKSGTAPASNTDGDVIFKANTGMASTTGSVTPVNIQQFVRIKIAAGKGLYLNQVLPNSAAAQLCEKTVLYTLL